MFNNKKVVYGLCVALFVLLLVLMILERRFPEAGSDFVQGLLHRG